MEFTANPAATIEAGIDAASALLISYSFSVPGAILLIVAGYVFAGVTERWVFAGLGQVRGST